MPLCSNCGTQLGAEVKVCFICGTPVERPGDRACPACGKSYPASYPDAFCSCGVELASPPGAAPADPAPVERPVAGTRCLVLYSANRRPLRYFALTRDVTLIGRLDAVQGCFPDI